MLQKIAILSRRHRFDVIVRFDARTSDYRDLLKNKNKFIKITASSKFLTPCPGFEPMAHQRHLPLTYNIIHVPTRDRCYDFKNIFAEKIGVFD
jgi:hypothetical protein